ncbi:DUF1887 family protein [Candidatus Woesearchaeota archaeon]|nr:DUF1887 family protein [Candidatus Woesearchaeota archaeon]
MNIHIAPVGQEIGHVRVALNELRGIDKLYLFTGDKFKQNADDLKKSLADFGVDVVVQVIDPFSQDSIQNILDYIIDIVKKHAADEVYINITGGTNLMGAAALSAAYFVGAKAYYVLDSRKIDKSKNKVVMLPIPKISFFDALTETQKKVLLDIATHIAKKGPIQNIQAYAKSIGWSHPRIKPHLDALEQMQLIEVDRTARECTIKLTKSAETILNFIK